MSPLPNNLIANVGGALRRTDPVPALGIIGAMERASHIQAGGDQFSLGPPNKGGSALPHSKVPKSQR
jgi:hypothetical protein